VKDFFENIFTATTLAGSRKRLFRLHYQKPVTITSSKAWHLLEVLRFNGVQAPTTFS